MPRNNKRSSAQRSSSASQNRQSNNSRIFTFTSFIQKIPFKKIFFGFLLATGGLFFLNRRNNTDPDITNENSGLLRSNLTNSLCNNEHLILFKGNFSSTTTKVLLGEMHEDNDISQRSVKCTEKISDQLGNQEHVILLEGTPSDMEVPCSNYKLKEKPNRKCMGWEDRKSLQKAAKQFITAEQGFPIHELKSLYDKLAKSGNANSAINTELDKYLEGGATFMKKKYVSMQLKYGIKIIDTQLLSTPSNSNEIKLAGTYFQYLEFTEMLEARKTGASYTQIFKNKQTLLSSPLSMYESGESDALLQRNKSLVKALRQHHGIFTIAIAGDGHVYSMGKDSAENKAVEYLHAELEKDKDQNPYAILTLPIPAP